MCAKCFFCCAPLGARPFSGARPEQKKTPPRVSFVCSVPGERQGKEKPRAGTGPEQKHHPGRIFLLRHRRKAPARGQSKKQDTTQVVFFLLRPRGKAGEGEPPLGAGTGPKQKKTPPRCFCFLDNNKKCLGYYIGSKKTRRGHRKKQKKHHFPTHTVKAQKHKPKSSLALSARSPNSRNLKPKRCRVYIGFRETYYIPYIVI